MVDPMHVLFGWVRIEWAEKIDVGAVRPIYGTVTQGGRNENRLYQLEVEETFDKDLAYLGFFIENSTVNLTFRNDGPNPLAGRTIKCVLRRKDFKRTFRVGIPSVSPGEAQDAISDAIPELDFEADEELRVEFSPDTRPISKVLFRQSSYLKCCRLSYRRKERKVSVMGRWFPSPFARPKSRSLRIGSRPFHSASAKQRRHLLVAEPREAILAPVVGARARVVVRKGFPRVPVAAVVLADRAPRALAQVRAPAAPGGLVLAYLPEPLVLDRGRRVHRHGSLTRRAARAEAGTIRRGWASGDRRSAWSG